MNYIWELIIRAIRQNKNPDEIVFKYGQPFSGYMELSFEDINESRVLDVVEINPFYRYYPIFKNIFSPDQECGPLEQTLLDLLVHHLAKIDCYMGMNKKEYYIRFLVQDMFEGRMGSFVAERLYMFSSDELVILANNLLNLYRTGECIYLLKSTIGGIFTQAYIFSNAEERDEVILFLRTAESPEKREKIEVIKLLFLPFKYRVEIYWEEIFGVLGVEELMRIEQMVNY